MKRLTPREIASLHQRLETWQSPEAMLGIVEPINSTIYFCQPGLAFLRDAWTGAEFARVRRLDQVRLVADRWPDFEIRVGGKVLQFEAVEADDPDRRRGDEYRGCTGQIEDDPVEDWTARAEQTPAWLAAACQRKADKRYGGRANLVINLNVGEYGIRQREIESCFPSATVSVKDIFDSVWVLWKARAHLVWQGGQPGRVA